MLDYDWLGSRLRRVGPYEVTYDSLGTRVRTVGPMTIEYDQVGTRPKRILLPAGDVALTESQFVAVFFVLYEQEQEQEQETKR